MGLIEEKHDLAVSHIAREVFTFPGGELKPGVLRPTWRTYTNVPQRQMPIQHVWEGEFYPDIVIADTARCNTPMIVAEVEDEDSLTEEVVVAKWRLDVGMCPIFYLFVPEGCAKKAANLCLDFRAVMHIPHGFYTYGFDKEWNFRLTPV